MRREMKGRLRFYVVRYQFNRLFHAACDGVVCVIDKTYWTVGRVLGILGHAMMGLWHMIHLIGQVIEQYGIW